MRGLEFDEDQRQAVDEADQIGAASCRLSPGDPELRGDEEVVVGGRVPVDDADGDALSPSPRPSPFPVRAAAGRLEGEGVVTFTPSFNS